MQKMPLATEKSIEIEKMNLALASFRRALATEAFFPTFRRTRWHPTAV